MKRMQTYGQPRNASSLLSKMMANPVVPLAVLKRQGHTCMQNGNFASAIESYEAVLEIEGDHPEILSNMGNAYQALNQYEDAARCYERALKVNPQHAIALTNLGGLLVQQKKYADAVAIFVKVVAMSPQLSEVHYNLGSALYELGEHSSALDCFDRALSLNPKLDLAHIYRGNTLIALHRYDDAVAAYDQALLLNPTRCETFFSRGNAHKRLRHYKEAMRDFMQAIEHRPDFAKAYWNLGLMLLVMGEFEQGWRLHEWRWKLPELGLKSHHFSQPLWIQGENIVGKHLFICDEQGLGDKIQMMRYAPLLAKQGVKVSLEVPKPLWRLAQTLGEGVVLIEEGQAPTDFDCYCPYMSLPLATGTTLNSVPNAVPYLAATEDASSVWATRLGAMPEGKTLRVGLAWTGAAIHTNDKNRSMCLQDLLPLLDVQNLELVSLQKEYRLDDQRLLRNLHGDIRDMSSYLTDFAETAALIQNLDLVISIDTSIAHLAGAMGKPVMLLLPYTPDFRWLQDRPDSPWYPTMHLFRQSSPTDWPGVVTSVKHVLENIHVDA